MSEAPEWVVNDDDRVIAVRFDRARSPAEAYRRVVEDIGHDWVFEDLVFDWSDDISDYRPNIGDLKALVSSVKIGWLRPWSYDEDGEAGDFQWGEDTWFWCAETHPRAVKYWDLGND